MVLTDEREGILVGRVVDFGPEKKRGKMSYTVRFARVWTIRQYFLKGGLKILTPWTTCFLGFLK